MLIKISSILGALIISGIISRLLLFIFFKKRRTIATVISINLFVFVVLFFIGISLFQSIELAENIWRSLLLFIAPLFIWITIDLASLNSSTDKKIRITKYEFSLISFLITLSLIIATGVLYYYPTDDQRAARKFKNEVTTLVEEFKDPESFFDETKLLDEDPYAEGLDGEFERLTRQIINLSIESRNNFNAKLSAAGSHKLLDPYRLRGALNQSHTEKIVDESLRIIDEYSSQREILLDEIKLKFKIMNIDEDIKARIFYDFNKSLEEGEKLSKEILVLEGQTITKIGELAIWLGANNDAWKFDNGQYMFYQDLDIDTFNNYKHEIDIIMSKQSELNKEAQNRFNQALSF